MCPGYLTAKTNKTFSRQLFLQISLFANLITESPRTQEIRLENERLQAEIAQLKIMLRGQSPEGAVGGQNQNLSGVQISDSNSFEENNVKVEKLENELRIAKELIQSK